MVLDADEGIEASLTEVVFDLVDQLSDVGEPEGLRRAGGGLVRPPDAGGNHNGAPLRQERTGPGVRGTASPVRPLLRQRRGRWGVRRGAQHPLARAQCFTLGRLAYAQVACRRWHSGGHLGFLR